CVCVYKHEFCTLLLAAHLLGDQTSLLNWLGFALCLLGISLHIALKAVHSRGDGGYKPLKGLDSSPDLELLGIKVGISSPGQYLFQQIWK
uniref:Uncharacterized protein n=1 Tax=Urocitellus parryii TaxID=9999 RepID=A0A8D2IQF2_UROPR